MMGYLVAHQSWSPTIDLLGLIFASCCLYASGMVLNDLCDVEADREIAPGRPLPAGQISLNAARKFYLALTGLGLLASLLVSFRSLLVAAGIVVAIFLYDNALKKTLLAPVAMGLCRFLNILLGASTVVAADVDSWFRWPEGLIWIGISLWLLIIGITLLAKNENKPISHFHLYFASVVTGVGLLGFVAAPIFVVGSSWHDGVYILTILAIGVRPFMRTFSAIKHYDGKQVRLAVIAFLQSLILLDAAVCFLTTGNLFYAFVVVSLIIPAKLLARTISPT